MKKFCVFSLLLMLILSSTLVFAESVNDKFSVSTTMRYRYWLEKPDGGDYDNEFRFDRVYLTLKGKLSDKINARVSIDFSHKNKYDTRPDGSTSLINYGTRTRIKYAYMDFQDFLGLKNLDMVFGNYEQPGQQSYHGTIETCWSDRYSNGGSFSDGYSSAVTGLMATYNLPNKFGYVRLATANKNTYNYGGDDNQAKNIIFDAWFHPVNGVTTFVWGLRDFMYAGNNSDHNDNFGFGAEYALGDKLDTGVEISFGEESISSTKGASYSGYVNYNLLPKLMLVGQVGMHDNNTNVDDDEMTMLLGGFNYKIVGKCQLMFNAKAEQYKVGGDSKIDMTYLTQLLIRF